MFQKLAFLKVMFQKKSLLNQAAYARPLTRSTENLYAEENEKTFLIEASFHYWCKSRVYSCNLIKKGLHYKGTPHGFSIWLFLKVWNTFYEISLSFLVKGA